MSTIDTSGSVQAPGSTAVAPQAAAPAVTSVDANPNHARRWWILGVVALAQLVVVLDATIVNIALPSAQAALGFSNDSRQWIVTAYALAFGSLLLLGGRLSDLIGRKPMFIAGLTGFALASAVGGAAENFATLAIARGAQGIFGAMLAPAALSLLTVTFSDPKERGRAFAIFGAIAGGGGAIGLILGGALTEYLSWRWCLYVNVPLAVIGVVGAALLLRNQQRVGKTDPLDIPGVVLSVAGLVSLVYGLSTAESKGWSSATTVIFIGLGVVLLAVFVVAETRSAHPLLPMRILLDRNRAGSYVAVGLVGAGLFGVFLFLTYYMSTLLAYTPLKTGVSFLPMIIGLVISAQIAAPVVARIGGKLPVTAGFAVAAAGMFYLTRLDLQSSYWADIFPGLVVIGLGIGFVIAPSFASATAGVRNSDAGVASAAVNTFQQIGGSIATAVLSAFAGTAAANYLVGKNPADKLVQANAALASYTTAFWWSAGILAAGAIVCGLLLRRGVVQVDPDASPVLAH